MTLSERSLNRATLSRQLLLERAALPVTDAVRAVGALQAQEPASPYLAMWARVSRFDPVELDAAFAAGEVLKASMMRLTLHTVHADDHPLVRAAMLPSLRAAGLNDRRYRDTGLSTDDFDRLLVPLQRFAREPRSKVEIEAFLGEHLGTPATPGLWRAVRYAAPLRHAADPAEPWMFGARARFVAAPVLDVEHPIAVAHLVVRYLAAFGPATTSDIAQFSMLRQPVIREALASLGDDLVEIDVAGKPYLDLRDAGIPDADVPAPPRLLPMWDSVLLAYADRSRIVPDRYRRAVIRRNGDVLPTVLVDGHVAGVWRPADGAIEITAFEDLPDGAWEALERESGPLADLLGDRGRAVSVGHGRWWGDLPRRAVRMLG